MGKIRTGVIIATIVALLAGLAAVVASSPAQAAKPIYIPKPQYEKPFPREVISAGSAHRKIPRGKPGNRALEWPTGATSAKGKPDTRVLKAPKSGADVSIEPKSRSASESLGIDGPVFAIESSDPGNARVSFDYSAFEHAYGGSWGSRLQLVQLPACALTTPAKSECRTATALPDQEMAGPTALAGDVDLTSSGAGPNTGSDQSDAADPSDSATPQGPAETESNYPTEGPSSNDPSGSGEDEPSGPETGTDTRKRSATAAATAVVALTAGPSGAGGDFTATSLQASGSWSQGGSTGGFDWSYPVPMPVPGTGSAPPLGLSYNSQAVDGQNSASNAQPSWVGEGWDSSAGYVERSYRTCKDDTTLAAGDKTPDSCWAGQILTVHMPDGPTTAIVKDDDTDTWRPAADNGYRVERKTGADNGSHQGEYWVITTTDGTQYTFGREMLAGASAADRTNSAWTVPVFSPKSGDPCNDAAGKRCTMAYRWNLDLVEDVHGNATVYSYEQETNHYKSQGASGTLLKYVRGGYLTSIKYGLSTNGAGLFTTAPQRVSFQVAERCWPYTDVDTGEVHGCSDADFKDDPAAWMDTPADQNCDASGACDNTAPSYWTRKRLTKITTAYWDGTAYQDVDTVALSQSFHNVGDNQLVLDGITRTGHSASPAITAPPITFTYDQRDNHVAGVHNMPSSLHQRLVTITTETGQVITVHYSGDPGQAGRAKPVCTNATLPASPATNTTSCLPVKWTPLGYDDPILDYFHKYVVTQIDVNDKNGTAPARPTVYKYVGDPAWHYDDNEVVKPKYRTWGQFRGYQEVHVLTGDPAANIVGQNYGAANDKQTLNKTFYLRGMHGDRTNTDPRVAEPVPSEGGKITDLNQYAGIVYETQQYNGTSGGLIAKTISRPTTTATTAKRARTGLDALTATIVRTARSDSYTTIAAGGRLTASTTTAYDNRGRALEVTSTGSGGVGNCVKTSYVDNDNRWVRDRASEVKVYETTCPTTATPTPTLLKHSRTYYDGSNTLGTIGIGEPTRQDDAKSPTEWVRRDTSYDAYGRTTSVKAFNPGAPGGDRVVTTAYTPAGTGALTKITTTSPDPDKVETRWLDPARGDATKTVGVDGLVTQGTFDALGRLTAVWRPGQTKGTDQATEKYDYLLGPDKPLAVTTSTLVDPGNGTAPSYRKRVVIFDAFGAVRQAQLQGAGNTVAVTDSFTDTHGWPVKNYDHWYTLGAPTTDILGGVSDTSIDGWKVTNYDGAGRPTDVTSRKGTTVTGTITTVYGGDRVTILPPTGGVAHTQIINGLGQKTEFDQYTAAPTRTGDVITGGSPQIVKYTYDGAGRQKTQTTAYGTTQATTWTNTYDLLGRVAQAVSPDAGTTVNTYFDTGEVATTKDGNNKTIAFDYDVLGRKVGKYANSLTGTQLASWTYDTLLEGHLTSSSSTVAGATYTRAATGFDNAGRPLGEKVSLSQLGFNADYTTSQTWTSTGLQATSTFAGTETPSGAGDVPETVTYAYDEVGNPRTMAGTNTYVASSTYTPYGEASQLVLGVNNQTGSLNFTRDVETRDITQATLTGQTAYPQIEKMAYTYDAVGNVTKLVDTQGGSPTSPVETHCFNYDKLRQLTEAWSSTDACATRPSALGNTTKVGGPQPYALSWSFDAAGNRTQQVARKTGTMTADHTTTYTIGGTGFTKHQVAKAELKIGTATTASTTRTFTYDPAGNIKTRTITTGTTSEATTFTYGADGTIDTVAVPTGNSKYVRDADGNILARADTSGTTKTTTLYLPGQEVAVATTGTSVGATTVTKYYNFNGLNVAMRVNKGNVRYLMADRNGTNQVAVNPLDWTVTRRTFDPYGNQVGATTPTGATFPGARTFINKPYVALTKLVDIGARLYDPAVGRFTSVDPVLFADDPQQANGYSYADNNPISFTDPSGLNLLDSPGGGGGGGSVDTKPESPPSSTEQFRNGFVDGAGEGVEEFVQSLNPSTIIDGLKSMSSDFLDNPVKSLWGFVKTVVSSFAHASELKDAWDAYNDENWEELGRIVGKLVVDVGGQIATTLLGGSGPLKLVTDAIADAKKAPDGGSSHDGSDGSSGCLRSFAGETLVRMADGSLKPIRLVVVGDLVLATDPRTGKEAAKAVTQLWVHADTLYEIGIGHHALVTTEDHLFWSETDGQWERADQLSTGETVLSSTGNRLDVTEVIRTSTGHAETAYNLTVEDVHTYHVGPNSVLVHNDGGPDFTIAGDYEGRVDRFTIGGQAYFEVHVYRKGTEVGIYGSSGWIGKHGHSADMRLSDVVENRLKGVAVDEMRRAGRLGPEESVKGDAWKRPHTGDKGGAC